MEDTITVYYHTTTLPLIYHADTATRRALPSTLYRLPLTDLGTVPAGAQE